MSEHGIAYTTGRRRVLKAIGAGSVAGLAGCIGGSGGGGGNGDKPNAVTFGTWGGSWQDLCIEAAIDPFRKEENVKVNYILGSQDRFNKLLAQKSDPPMHLDQQGLPYLSRGAREEVYTELNEDLVPAYAKVPDKLKTDRWMAHHFTASALVYNTDNVSNPPKNIGDAYLNPEYKGRIALAEPTQRGPQYDLMAFSLYKTNGKTFKDIEAAFEMYEEVVKTMNPKFGGATEQYGKWFANGDIDVARIWAARSASWQQNGDPVDYVLPKEGAMIYSAGHGITENSTEAEKKWAGVLCDYFYRPSAAKKFAQQMNYPVVNKEVEYSEEVSSRVPLLDDLDNLTLPDYQWMGKNVNDWTNRANEIIQKHN